MQQTRGALEVCYEEQVLSHSRVMYWHKAFRTGRNRILDKPRAPRRRTGRSAGHIAAVKNIVDADRRTTIASMSHQTGLPFGTLHKILHADLGLVKKSAKYVPQILLDAQKDRRVQFVRLWQRLWANNQRIFETVVTMDESWVYMYDPLLKSQSQEWLRPQDRRPQKARRGRATGKVMIISFFDAAGMVYYEYLQGGTVKQKIFRQICTRFREAHRLCRPNSVVNGKTFFHMDNASPHTATESLRYLQQDLGLTILPHPAYSPDLAPNDFWFYSRLKGPLRGRQCPSLADLRHTVDQEISTIRPEEYRKCMLESWPRRWARCIEEKGAYFEGMK